ncbi:cell division protein ZapE [Streptomyces sp. 4F]|nr:cell division protein ZapE [Streptomyces sp. 4F]
MISRRQVMNRSFDSLHLVNTYGAFGTVSRIRHEVVIEGTADEVARADGDWREYEFKGKPGDPRRWPRQFAPYHLRLDWLMWFVALSPAYAGSWFGTFVELTNLVGALGFQQTVRTLSGHRLLCIDEFELDDPGDTVLVSSLLGRLVEAGVALAATSNTLPGKLGEGRFAAADFLREIQGLSAHFRTLRIDGEDYRHRGLPEAPAPYSDAQVTRAAQTTEGASLDDFPALLDHLARVHPSRYGALTDGVAAVCLTGVRPVPDQSTALRLVVLADRLYDREVPVLASGLPFDRLFGEEMLKGGYRKKYFRAISRLTALARDAARLVDTP